MKMHIVRQRLGWRFSLVILFLLILSFILMIVITSCSTITSSIIGGAESGLGRAISESVEQSVYKKTAPKETLPPPQTSSWNQYMASQAYVIFSYSFSAGGYWFGTDNYKEGEWTKFQIITDDGDKIIIEKAFLKRLPDGNEWWRVSLKDKEDEWVYEALISPEDGKLLRLRGRDADGNEGEIPVTEGSQGSVYENSQKLTEESLKGATVGTEKVKTPAGTFKADHVVYMAMGEGKLEFWLNDSVPGRIVKYVIKDREGKTNLTSELVDYGDGARTVLQSF